MENKTKRDERIDENVLSTFRPVFNVCKRTVDAMGKKYTAQWKYEGRKFHFLMTDYIDPDLGDLYMINTHIEMDEWETLLLTHKDGSGYIGLNPVKTFKVTLEPFCTYEKYKKGVFSMALLRSMFNLDPKQVYSDEDIQKMFLQNEKKLKEREAWMKTNVEYKVDTEEKYLKGFTHLPIFRIDFEGGNIYSITWRDGGAAVTPLTDLDMDWKGIVERVLSYNFTLSTGPVGSFPFYALQFRLPGTKWAKIL